MRWCNAIGLLALSAWAGACSGPGARETMTHAVMLGYLFAGCTTFLALCSWIAELSSKRERPLALLWPVMLTALSGVQPGWYVSAYQGDCGATRIFGGTLVLALAFGVYFGQLGSRRYASGSKYPWR